MHNNYILARRHNSDRPINWATPCLSQFYNMTATNWVSLRRSLTRKGPFQCALTFPLDCDWVESNWQVEAHTGLQLLKRLIPLEWSSDLRISLNPRTTTPPIWQLCRFIHFVIWISFCLYLMQSENEKSLCEVRGEVHAIKFSSEHYWCTHISLKFLAMSLPISHCVPLPLSRSRA